MNHWYKPNSGVNATPIQFSTAGSEVMRLGANGSLGIGTSAPNPSITVGREVLDEAMIKGLKELKGFLDYAEQTGSEVGSLWTAYKAANKLESK